MDNAEWSDERDCPTGEGGEHVWTAPTHERVNISEYTPDCVQIYVMRRECTLCGKVETSP
jgi:hypothetical protein